MVCKKKMLCIRWLSCADPESFVTGGSKFNGCFYYFFVVDEGEGGSKYHYKRTIIALPAKRHFNGVLLACR